MFQKISQISQESLFNKVAVLRTCNFIKKRLQHRCFPVKFAKFLRTTNLKNICKRLLLNLFKKGLEHMCFPVNFVNYSGTPILKSTYKQLVPKHHCRRFSLTKLQAWWSEGLQQYQKETLAQVFFCEFCVIFRKIFCGTPPSCNHFSHDDVVVFVAIIVVVVLSFSFLQISEVCSQKSIYLEKQW